MHLFIKHPASYPSPIHACFELRISWDVWVLKTTHYAFWQVSFWYVLRPSRYYSRLHCLVHPFISPVTHVSRESRWDSQVKWAIGQACDECNSSGKWRPTNGPAAPTGDARRRRARTISNDASSHARCAFWCSKKTTTLMMMLMLLICLSVCLLLHVFNRDQLYIYIDIYIYIYI